jgi:hypothetical protein
MVVALMACGKLAADVGLGRGAMVVDVCGTKSTEGMGAHVGVHSVVRNVEHQFRYLDSRLLLCTELLHRVRCRK